MDVHVYSKGKSSRLSPNDVWLPEFIEIYISSDLNIKLTRRDIS